MYQNDNTTPTARRVLRALRLIESGDRWLMTPALSGVGPSDNPSFHPRVLPHVPDSLVQWWASSSELLWRQRQRCIAALFLVGWHSGHWTIRLPRQRCGVDAACWTVQAEDLPGLPEDACFGGSFQTRVVGRGEHPIDTVPPTEGVHLVLCIGQGKMPSRIWTFVRAGDSTREVKTDRIIANDWVSTIDEAMPRLRLA